MFSTPSVPSVTIKNFLKKHATSPYVSTLKHATPTKPTVAYAPPKKPNVAHMKAYAAPKTNYVTPTKTYFPPITSTHKDILKKGFTTSPVQNLPTPILRNLLKFVDYDFEFPL
eukprot:3417661-Ditylum_brightwellii.AAC.1